MASPIVTMSFTEATQKRRTIRALESKTTVPESIIIKLIEAAILTVPSWCLAFPRRAAHWERSRLPLEQRLEVFEASAGSIEE